jgi:uracil-DNA glycosylase
MKWNELKYWQSGEWQVIQEHLKDVEDRNELYCPNPNSIFRSLVLVPFERVRVAILGQDPYPSLNYATGVAYSIPEHIEPFQYPPTLNNILKEYKNDLHYPEPTTGNLEEWCEEGVLLWNVIPTCKVGKPLSHDWDEWKPLTQEIVEKLDEKGCVFVFTGGKARSYTQYVQRSTCIECSHPSPRGCYSRNNPFMGSRIFSHVNSYLTEPIDWSLK